MFTHRGLQLKAFQHNVTTTAYSKYPTHTVHVHVVLQTGTKYKITTESSLKQCIYMYVCIRVYAESVWEGEKRQNYIGCVYV